MLRLKYVILQEGQKIKMIETPAPLEHLRLIYNYEVLNGRVRIFQAMSGDFDPGQKVILETQPAPPFKPGPAKDGNVQIVDSSTDYLTHPGGPPQSGGSAHYGYSKDWRAIAVDGGVQKQYEVMPADYVLMAVPLSSGHHHFRIEYAPRAFTIGKWIPLASLSVFLGVSLVMGWRRKRESRPGGKEVKF